MTTPIGGAGAKHGVDGADAVSGAGPEGEGALSSGQGEGARMSGTPRARPRSLDMGGASLAADLHARLDAKVDDEDGPPPTDEQVARRVLEDLEATEGKGSRALGALFDDQSSVEKAGRSILRQSAVSGLLSAFTGAGSGGRISSADVQELVGAAKDYQKITRAEWESIGSFVKMNASSFEKGALLGIIAFTRKHGPASVVADLDGSEEVKRALR